jgi:hypothetical protein
VLLLSSSRGHAWITVFGATIGLSRRSNHELPKRQVLANPRPNEPFPPRFTKLPIVLIRRTVPLRALMPISLLHPSNFDHPLIVVVPCPERAAFSCRYIGICTPVHPSRSWGVVREPPSGRCCVAVYAPKLSRPTQCRPTVCENPISQVLLRLTHGFTHRVKRIVTGGRSTLEALLEPTPYTFKRNVVVHPQMTVTIGIGGHGLDEMLTFWIKGILLRLDVLNRTLTSQKTEHRVPISLRVVLVIAQLRVRRPTNQPYRNCSKPSSHSNPHDTLNQKAHVKLATPHSFPLRRNP